MPSEEEMAKMELATIYELRLLFTSKDKKNYTLEEIIELLDDIARSKSQP